MLSKSARVLNKFIYHATGRKLTFHGVERAAAAFRNSFATVLLFCFIKDAH